MEPVDFRDLYERHAGDVRRFAFYLCGERARADDLAAEAFARAWTSVGELRTPTVKAYLFRIVRNLVVEGARKNDRVQAIEPSTADVRPGPVEAADGRIELQAVLAALQRLPESDRAALLMRAQDGMSHEEIAAALELSVAAVRVRIHRARLALSALKIREERKP